MKKLHYADISNNEDIPCYEFKTFNKLIDFISDKMFNEDLQPYSNIVYLLTYEEKGVNGAVVIDECCGEILDHLEAMKKFDLGEFSDGLRKSKYYNNYFLQEYESYEDAYRVALDMREISELCYNK